MLTETPPLPAASRQYGFVIDNRKCIGCHACSTACKSENEVPLGVYRTWVKYVETGRYPDVRRHFQVTRCNHCANPPCARICPVEAMYQREDGIVEFDGDVCIGCKACMQACPYDAIYIDPETNTAAKCHYCAHRTDIGLEPACVVVCPEQAIIAGDMNDPQSEIAQLLARETVSVRKPEQGTAPKLFYIDGHDAGLHPTATERAPETFMWADVLPLHPAGHEQTRARPAPPTQPRNRPDGDPAAGATATPIRRPQPQGQPWNGPIHIGEGRMAAQMVQVGYNAQHKIPWHWPVPAYLVTKGIGAGIFMLLSLGGLLNGFPVEGGPAVAAGFLSLLFIAITTGLLVIDLDRPERFFYILLRPQWHSWLARGAVALLGFTLVGGLWWLLAAIGFLAGDPGWAGAVRQVLLAVGLPLAVLVAIYTAFLFAQAEGRDLWQSPLLPLHFLVQSLMVGSGAFFVLALFREMPAEMLAVMAVTFPGALMLDLFIMLAGEFYIPHASEVAARAAHEIRAGRYRSHFWWGSITLGHVIPLVALLAGLLTGGLAATLLAAFAALCAVAGLYFYEYAFVMAPQEIPNS